jgi:hypothetical protein
MAKQKKKAQPRGTRNFPQEERIYSTNFLSQMVDHKDKCFVPLEDFQKLQKKYISLFKRYQRPQKRLQDLKVYYLQLNEQFRMNDSEWNTHLLWLDEFFKRV